jgi:anti-sigma factor RsiW
MSSLAGHVLLRERLVAYVNGTLADAARRAVEEHLAACPACRREAAAWRAVAEAATRSRQDAPSIPPVLPFVNAVLAAAGAQAEAAGRARSPIAVCEGHLRHLVAVLMAQRAVVRRGLWATSALTFALGWVIIVAGSFDAGGVLALLAPLVAAGGVAAVCGPSVDARLEVALSTATSPRLVLLARLVLIFAFDLALAVLASFALAAGRHDGGVWQLIAAWLGPMLLLSSLSLVVAGLTRRPALGITVGFGLWALRVLSWSPGMPLHDAALTGLAGAVWSTTLPIVVVSGVLLLTTFIAAGREVAT